MQKDLDAYPETYNERRPHREVFKVGIPRKRTRKTLAKKDVKKAAEGPDLGEARCQLITVCGRPRVSKRDLGTESVAV